MGINPKICQTVGVSCKKRYANNNVKAGEKVLMDIARETDIRFMPSIHKRTATPKTSILLKSNNGIDALIFENEGIGSNTRAIKKKEIPIRKDLKTSILTELSCFLAFCAKWFPIGANIVAAKIIISPLFRLIFPGKRIIKAPTHIIIAPNICEVLLCSLYLRLNIR